MASIDGNTSNIERLARFCGLESGLRLGYEHPECGGWCDSGPAITEEEKTHATLLYQVDDGYWDDFDPYTSHDDAALLRRKCHEKSWLWAIFQNGNYQVIITARKRHESAWHATEYSAFCAAVLAAIEGGEE